MTDPKDATAQGQGFMSLFNVNDHTLIDDTIDFLEHRREDPKDDSLRVPHHLNPFWGT